MENIPAATTSLITLLDSCGAVTITTSERTTGTGCGTDTMVIERKYIITDGVSIDSCVQLFYVIDNIAPTIDHTASLFELAAELVVDCAGDVPSPNARLMTTMGGCANDIIFTQVADSISNFTCPNNFLITRIYTATDLCGNSTTLTQLIYVDDNLPPVITCPPDVTVSCIHEVPVANVADVFQVENCICSTTTTFEEEITANVGCPDNFMIARIYTVADSCGNTATCTQRIMVEDNTVPMIIGPADITVGSPMEVPAPDMSQIITMDNCTSALNVSVAPDLIVQAICPNNYTISRLYTAEDACENIAVYLQTISVRDITDPTTLVIMNDD